MPAKRKLGRGRPPLAFPENRRDCLVTVKLTYEEREELRALARRLKKTMSTFVRQLISVRLAVERGRLATKTASR